MSLVHIHLLLNHFPVVGAFGGILLFAIAYQRDSSELARFGMAFFTALGIVTVLVYFTGLSSDEVARGLPAFSLPLLERHEEAGLASTVIMGALGGTTAFALWIYGPRRIHRRVTGAGVLLALGAAIIMTYTGYLGDQIRHTEVRSASGPIADLHAPPPPK